jgi:hypothetical protein
VTVGEDRWAATVRNAARPRLFDNYEVTCDIGASSAHEDESAGGGEYFIHPELNGGIGVSLVGPARALTGPQWPAL